MNERQKSILRILGEDRELSVTDLSERFQVSGVTIRQDLDFLQTQGLLKRVHGGAVLHGPDDIAHRLGVNYEKKLSIASLAAAHIKNGDTVFIEAGSTNAILARQLACRSGITVVTNNIFIARALKGSHTEVILLGGVYQHDSECVVGSLARSSLSSLNFTKAFIGTDGFTHENGFTCSNMLRAEIAGAAVARAALAFVLTDSPKFGRSALTRICPTEDVDYVVTDHGIPDEHKNVLEAAHVHVEVAMD
jgi:DeoR/GlpR family transcriptional regulator of sugar metabolism